MFEFNKEAFKNNKVFLILASIVVIVFFAGAILLSNHESKLKEQELEANGKPNIGKLVINEIMSSNGGAYASSDGVMGDWIELYNGNNHDINLKNYGLSDKDNTVKWVFPEYTIKANSYLVIDLTGQKEDGLKASFKLSSSGKEMLALKNPSGKAIDAIETIALEKNQVMARDLKGDFIKTSMPTPGFVNTKEGYDAYYNSITDLDGKIKINEVLPRNDGNFANEDGIYSGYIEIINNSSKDINIKDYSISNDKRAPFKFQLPDKILKDGETFLVYTSSHTSDKYLYSNFKLENKNGSALLTNNKGKIIDQVDYTNLANGMALVRNKDTFYETNNISPNYNNVKEFSEHYLKNKKSLIINEVMNSNSSFLGQNGNEFYDWIELLNNTDKDIRLSDYYLTTNEENSTMYKLPDIILKPGQLYVVMASGDINLSNNSYKHTNFKLSQTEALYIMKDNSIIDSMFIANVPVNYSMGRNSNNGFYYFENPTPNKNNGSGVLEISYNLTYDKEPGIYNGTQNIKLELTGSGTIYYSLDGSEPTTSSKVYNGPIFLDKTTVVKAINSDNGKINSKVKTLSYIINENHKLPVMSVSLDNYDFNVVKNKSSANIEVEAYAELYEDGKSFSIPCGFKLFGGSTRYLPKQSFALKFKKKYGAGSLNYQVFDNRDFSRFDTLVLRSGSQDNENAFIRDALMTSLVDGVTKLDVQAYKSVILYVNGNYYGVYNIREKVDETFVSNHYNVKPEKANIVRIDNDITYGSLNDYRHVVDYLNNNNMANSKNYEYIKTKLDIESFADYWAAQVWVTNNDIINTRFFSHPDIDNGRLKLLFYDFDYAMYHYMNNHYDFILNPEGMSDFKVSTEMMRSLIKNSDFKKLFLERISYQAKNVWNKERVNAKIDELYASLKPEMARDRNRWNYSMVQWEDCIKELKDYANKRGDYLKRYTKNFFNLSNSEVEKIFGA